MKLLLDTHTFIWWVSDPKKLSQKALAACHDPANILVLSISSIWEMQIKQQLGKLTFHLPLAQLIQNQQQVNRLQLLPIELAHVFELDSLLLHPKDPFDRMLVAQANAEKATLVSSDPLLAQYPVLLLW